VRKDLIESYIRQLRNSFGLKRPIGDEKLYALHQAKDYHGMVGVIMTALAIDFKVKLGLVNSGGPNAPAWIEKPAQFPPFFSPKFKEVEVTMYLRKTFLAEVGFETVVVAISHELSHVVLDSTASPLREHEEAVDLTAMLLGFRDFYVTGSIVKRKNEDYLLGYLSPEELSHAAWFMTYGQ